MTSGISDIVNKMFDFGSPLWHVQEKYITRKPQPLKPFSNILRPFSRVVWEFILIALTLLATTLLVLNKAYTFLTPLKEEGLAKAEESSYLFYLYVFTKMSEPDPLPWFYKWSAGRFLILIYCVMSAFLILSYTCNLKAYMTTIQYETPPSDQADIVTMEKTVYIPLENYKHSRYK